jgi:outer membrane receptor protein involved in Fe transport
LYDPKVGDLAVHNYIKGESLDEWYQASLTVNGKIGNWNVLYAGGYIRRHNSATADYSYYTVAYDTTPNFNYLNTAAGVPINPNQFVTRNYHFTKQNHEIRLSSPTGRRFQVQAGLFFQRQQANFRQDYFVPGAQAAVTAPTALVTGDDQFLNRGQRVDRDYAVFAQADFKITPTLTLTGGIRGFRYKNSFVAFSGTAGTVRSRCAGAVYSESCITVDKVAKGSGETHKASLSWQVTPDKMVYATYSTGFRPGGINRPLGFEPYDPDTLTNYELGFKTRFFDRRVRLNGAIYQEDWHGVQYSLPGANGVSSIVNAGNARVRGAEIDLSARLGRLTLSTSGAYNDAKLTTPFCNLPNGVLRCDLGVNAPKGTRLPVQPRLKGTVTARYEFEVGSTQLFTQASMLHQSNSTSLLRTRDNNALGNVPAFTTFDFSFGGKMSGNSTFELFINNAFDKRGQLSRNSQCVLLLCLRNGRVAPVKPQFFGVKVGQKF